MSELATLIPPGGLPSPTASKKTFGVEALNVVKRFGEFTALDAVSLKVKAGTFHALLGENGAGKSTLVKCIMGYYQADDGELLVDDRQQVINNPRAAHALGLGMVYQHFTLVPAMTGAGFHCQARLRPDPGTPLALAIPRDCVERAHTKASGLGCFIRRYS